MDEPATYRALLIANSTYPIAHSDLADLEGPRNDPALLREALCSTETGLFASNNVRLVQERSKPEVELEIEMLLQTATFRDTLLLYYSGHGRLDHRNQLYLCTRDTRPELCRSTAVSAGWISECVDQSAAGTVVIVLDCCHAGAFKGGDASDSLAGDGRFVIASARPSELAQDTEGRNRASVFTAAVVEGLRSGAQDQDGDGKVSVSDLYRYVHHQLTSTGKPTPHKRFSGTGDVSIALRQPLGLPHAPSGPTHPTDLVRPSAESPELDVTPMEINLGEVEPDEQLPPERVSVINRGGRTLQWRVETSVPWIRAEKTDYGAELHIRAPVGATRANVYFHDLVSQVVKTVRIRFSIVGTTAAATTNATASDSDARAMNTDWGQARIVGQSDKPHVEPRDPRDHMTSIGHQQRLLRVDDGGPEFSDALHQAARAMGQLRDRRLLNGDL